MPEGDSEQQTNYDQRVVKDIRDGGWVRVFEYVRRSFKDGRCPFCRTSENTEWVSETGDGGEYGRERYICQCGASGDSIWTWEAGTEPADADSTRLVPEGSGQ